MKTRKLELGERNMVGQRVTKARLAKGMKQNELLAKLQTEGIEISTPALSLLEGVRVAVQFKIEARVEVQYLRPRTILYSFKLIRGKRQTSAKKSPPEADSKM